MDCSFSTYRNRPNNRSWYPKHSTPATLLIACQYRARGDKADGAAGYLVRYRAAGVADWSDNMYTTSRKDTLTGLMRGTQYAWSVKTVCGLSPSSYSTWSRSDLFTTPSAKIESLISIAANPVQDILRVHIKSPDVSHLRITDLAGNTLLQTLFSRTDNDLSFAGRRTGIYLLQVLNRQKQVIGTAKIIKK